MPEALSCITSMSPQRCYTLGDVAHTEVTRMDDSTLSLFDRPVTAAHPPRCPFAMRHGARQGQECGRPAKMTTDGYRCGLHTPHRVRPKGPPKKRPVSRRTLLRLAGMKACSQCKRELPLDAFALRKPGWDVRQSQCQECQRAIMAKWSKTERGEAAKVAFRERHPGYDSGFRERYPLKLKCHRVFAQAKKRGAIIPQPCEVCGEPKVHGHHPDYAKPLDVMWLCVDHHAEWHKHHKAINGGDPVEANDTDRRTA